MAHAARHLLLAALLLLDETFGGRWLARDSIFWWQQNDSNRVFC
jgi:hypothetical protein